MGSAPVKQLVRITALLVVLATPVGATDLPQTEPDPSLPPQDVVSIQIEALQNNDIPYEDRGIEVTFNFASPANKRMTGPLERFKVMVRNPVHIPILQTERKNLTFSFPEIGNDPSSNVYYSVDLTKPPMKFRRNKGGGIDVPLFADLKRHHMGPSLAEFNGDDLFTTMRLWGVADTAPYLHDGRALTMQDAIELHGADIESEAHDAVQTYRSFTSDETQAVLTFLDSLRSPAGTNPDLDLLAEKLARKQNIE